MKPFSMGHAEVKGSTPSGLWLQIDDLSGPDVFIPYKHIHDDSEVYREDSEPGELVITEWLAEQRGWL